MSTALVCLAPRIYTAIISSSNGTPSSYTITLTCLCIDSDSSCRTTYNHWRHIIGSKVYSNSRYSRVISNTKGRIWQCIVNYIGGIAFYSIGNRLGYAQRGTTIVFFYSKPLYIKQLSRPSKGKFYLITITRTRAINSIGNRWSSIVTRINSSCLIIYSASVRGLYYIATIRHISKNIAWNVRPFLENRRSFRHCAPCSFKGKLKRIDYILRFFDINSYKARVRRSPTRATHHL